MKKILMPVMAFALAFIMGCGQPKEYAPKMPEGVEEASIFVEPIEGLSDDFLRGVDISTILVEEKAGAKYYTEDGTEEDVFKILADSGVNCVRVRVWNDPYDENGNGYGGGNCDVESAVEIGRRAAQYGMKMMVDFHFSDFWADPGKQMCPKAWVGMTGTEKGEAAYEFVLDAMNRILEGGADVGCVQLGNENNNGMAGETKWAEIGKIVDGGSRACKEAGEKYGKDIKIALHFTNPENTDGMKSMLRKLKNCEVEYDIFALSYYTYWHGSLDNLKEVMKLAQEKYGKDVMVVETAYMFTTGDGDGNGNSVSDKDVNKKYAPSPQGQANVIRDVCAAVSEVGGLGVFYWEPAWIPVDSSTWETIGTGWATSYAGAYDPDDAGRYYGGCAWDNQALFGFDGVALPSLSVFKYLKYGTTCELKITSVEKAVKNVNPGSSYTMPETVLVHYNDSSKDGPVAVTWNADDLAKVNADKLGEYTVKGKLEDGTEAECTVNVANVNWVVNPGFEEEDRSMWEFSFEGDAVLDFQQKETDASSGEWAMHYWRAGDVAFKASQTITGLDDGTYFLSMQTQGGDSGVNPKMYLFAESGGETYRTDFAVTGWIEWKKPEIKEIEVKDGTVTIGVCVDAGKGAWGTFDDFYLCRAD